MIDSLTLAEFHQTEGSKILFRYPDSPEVITFPLESYILPEGLHKFNQDSTFTIFRRKKHFSSIADHPKFMHLCSIEYRVDLHIFDRDHWKMISPDSTEGCLLQIFKEGPSLSMSFTHNNTTIMKIEIHKDLQFTVLESKFASLYTISGEAYGLFFKNNTQYELESLLNFNLDDKLDDLERSVYETSIYYCTTFSSIKKSSDYSRGAQIMGIGAISQKKHCLALKSILAISLDQIMDKPQRASRYLKRTFDCINKATWPELILTENEKKIRKWCYDKGYTKKNPNYCVPLSYNKTNVFIELDRLILDEEVVCVSLLKLYEVFKNNLMKIYTGLLEEKRIIVFSSEKTCWEIATMATAVVRLVSPPIPYLAMLHLFPFVHLNSLDFLNSHFFVAGANNPLFKHRTQWWDILADLDTGQVISQQPLSKMHQDFIENLKPALETEPNKELLIRSQFYDYTQHILDYNIYTSEFEKFNYKMPTQKIENSQILKYFSLKDPHFDIENTSQDLHLHLLRLRFMHITGQITDIDQVYKAIYKEIKKDLNLLKFLALLPNSGDLHCVAWGFFTENTVAWKYACKILSMIENNPEGNFLVTVLPTSELNAYLAYKNRI